MFLCKRLVSFSLVFIVSLVAIPAVASETSTLADGSQLKLKGIGLVQELRNDIYVGALYVPPGVKSMNLIRESNTPKRMSIRFVTDNYSYRKVSRHWKERIAMNTPREIWRPMTKDIVRFSALFQENLMSGDEINLDFVPGRGTLVYVNKILFQTINNPAFYDLLLNVWVGSVPPSKTFKQGILGQDPGNDGNLMSLYTSVTPKAGRLKQPPSLGRPQTTPRQSTSQQQVVRTSQQNPPPRTQNRPTTSLIPLPRENSDVATKPNQLANRPTKQEPKTTPQNAIDQNTLNNNSSVSNNSSQTASNTGAATNVLTNTISKTTDAISAGVTQLPPQINTNKLPDLGSGTTTENKTQATQLTPQQSSTQQLADNSGSNAVDIQQNLDLPPLDDFATPDLPPESLPIDDEIIDVDLIRGSFIRELIAAVRKHQTYPRKALINGEVGAGTALVVIDKNGALVEVTLFERTGSRTLDKAIIKMIRKASPFPVVPQELDEEQFEFEVPISFQL